jgi:hypothetical protein
MAGRKGFSLEINTTTKLIGIVVVGLILISFIASDFVQGNIMDLTEEIGFGDSQSEYLYTIHPKTPEWGGLVFRVDHTAVDDTIGGNEIDISINVQSNMNITAPIRAELYDESGTRRKQWPGGSTYRDLRPGQGWSADYDTRWSLADRGEFDGNNAGDHAYNVTLYMELEGNDELIGFYNATTESVPSPEGCWVCVGPVI